MKPTCLICGATGNGIQFPMLPRTAGYKFGEICDKCDE